MKKTRGKGSTLIRFGLGLLTVALLCEVGLRVYVGARGLDRSELATLLEPSAAQTSYGEELSTRSLLKLSRFDDLVYELEPGLRASFESRLLHTNSHGLRGGETSPQKPPGTVRIAGLGDDHMLGLGVAQGQTYLDLLGRRLNENAPEGVRYETLNFAVPAYNTAMQAATFEHKASRFDPDLVVIHYIGDDVNLPRFLPSSLGATSPSYVYDFLRAALGSPEDAEEGRTLRQAARVSKKQLRAMEEKYDYMGGVEGVEAALSRLASLTADSNIPVVLLMLGDGGRRRAAARDAAESHGFKVVNALPYFGSYLKASGLEETREEWRRLFYLSDGRPTAAAHKAYAGVLYETVRELGL